MIVASTPASGKSYWVLSEVINLATKHKARTMIFSPEMGDTNEIIALLVHMKTGKTIYKREGIEQIGEEELDKTLKWLNNYIVIVDSEEAMSIDDIYEQYDLFEKKYKKKINYIVLDNLNDIKEDFGPMNRQDLATEKMLVDVRRYNKKRNCFTFMVTHASSQGAPMLVQGIRFYPPITAREIRSGEAIFRKGYLIVTIWRTPYGLQDENGVPYKENESRLIVLKSKPDGVGIKSAVLRLFYNWRKASFSDKEEDVTPQGNFRPLTPEEQSDGDVPEVNY
jgi:hypothetical protein